MMAMFWLFFRLLAAAKFCDVSTQTTKPAHVEMR